MQPSLCPNLEAKYVLASINCQHTCGLVQALDGADGAKASDDMWPAFHKSLVQTSPFTFDFDNDNIPDIMVATYDGEILMIKDTVRDTPQLSKVIHPHMTLLTLSQYRSCSVHKVSL